MVECGYGDIELPKEKDCYVLRSCLFENVGRSKDFKYNENIVVGAKDSAESADLKVDPSFPVELCTHKVNLFDVVCMASSPIFEDENRQNFCGTGFFFKYGENLYFVTCAHTLSQKTNTI